MINLSKVQLTEAEIQAAVEVLRSGELRQGKQCHAFEAEYAEATGARFAISTSSGTAALHLAYMAFLEPGDEVLVPSFTFFATASVISLAGGRPIFCDVDPESYLIDLADAERRVTERTKAIAPVHLFGNACEDDRFEDFARRHEMKIVWDAAHAHGTTLNGKDVGGFGGMVAYSFYASKNMFIGEGGMICTDDEYLAHRIRFLRSHGQTAKYVHTMLGLNYRMTDFDAAIGREQLKRLERMVEARRRNADRLTEGLAIIPGIRFQRITDNCASAWHQFCVVIDPGKFGLDRKGLCTALSERGIGTGVHYPRGLHQQPIFRQMYGDATLPMTEYLSANIVALPVHHHLADGDIETILDTMYTIHEQVLAA